MQDRLKTNEVLGIMALLIIHIFVLPMGVSLAKLDGFGFWGLSESEINVAYYAAGVLMALLFGGNYLRRSFGNLWDRPVNALTSILVAWAAYYVLSVLLSTLLMQIPFFTEANPNQSSVESLLQTDRREVVVMTVYLAPIVEETIFRGGIFCGIYHKNRIAAYIVSMLAFALYHVWQAAFLVDIRMLLYAVEYLPAAFALCLCYEKSGSVWTAIALHAAMNAISIFAM